MRVSWDTKAEKLVDRLGDPAVSEAANIIADAVRRRTPVADEAYSRNGQPQQPGTLKNSVRVYSTKFKKPGRASYIVMAGGTGSWGDAFYARFVEMGTKNMTAKKFMRKGLRAARNKTLKIIQGAIGKGL